MKAKAKAKFASSEPPEELSSVNSSGGRREYIDTNDRTRASLYGSDRPN